ncbi:ferrous iron transport protein A [Corynebacterium sp. Q4381]|uniref:ferrous iron transport protein A n=1 Tax=Corynebacterium sp. Marseille-Q4381 TaxID=3121597 RepID=UPI002FE664FB
MQEHVLIDVPVGHQATITHVGCPTARRLRELGLRAGANVTVMQKTAGGGRVVKVGGSHYALGAAALRLITIAPAGKAA